MSVLLSTDCNMEDSPEGLFCAHSSVMCQTYIVLPDMERSSTSWSATSEDSFVPCADLGLDGYFKCIYLRIGVIVYQVAKDCERSYHSVICEQDNR